MARGSQSLNHQQALPHLHTLTTLCTLILSLGAVGALIGTISSLMNLDNPAAIGPAMAVTYLSTLYSLSLSELLIRPLRNKIYTQQSSFASTSSSPPVSSLGMMTLGIVAICMLSLMILMYSLTQIPK